MFPSDGIKVHWFDEWHPILDEAIQTLPESELCPHELYRLLIQNSSPVPKRTALITEDGVPVSVVGLRQRGRFSWELLTQWIIPGFVFPAKTEYLHSSLIALKKNIWVAWWRIEDPPQQCRLVRSIDITPTFRAHLSDNCEQYWRDNGYYKTIRRIRNQCKNLNCVINAPGSCNWTIIHWAEKWFGNSGSLPNCPDRILAANYLEKQGKYFTLMLLDEEIQVGGATMTVHNKDLVAGVLYWNPEYRKCGVGDRLIDLCFCFAMENGFEILDLGGGHVYKNKWAPQEGEHFQFNICPDTLFWIKQITHWSRNTLVRVTE